MNPVMEYLASIEMLMLFGVASGVLSTFAYIPYIIDTISKRTRPQRASWLIWSVLGSIAFMSQIFEGATSSLWFAGVQVGGTIIVFMLSIWIGQGRFLSKSDYLILVAAGVGLVLWYLTENAAYALAITISISLLGGAATVVKAYREPESETLITWVVSFVASVCALLSVGVVDYTLLAYPLYLFTLYLSFIVAIALGRRRDAHAGRTAIEASRRVSIATLFSGLRKTADAVIVSAAFVFAFNWIGANSSAVDTATLRASATGKLGALGGARNNNTLEQQPAEGPAEVETGAQGLFAAGSLSGNRGTLLENSVIDYAVVESTSNQGQSNQSLLSQSNVNLFAGNSAATPFSTADFIDTLADDVQKPVVKIVVVAVDSTQATVRPWILHDSDPLAKLAKSQVRDWLAEGADNNLAREIEPVAPTAPTPDLLLVAPPVVETAVPPAHVTTTASRFDPGHTKGYLQLDEDDPFAVLIVVSDTAALERDHDSVLPQSRLSRGERVHAIATNGEWYKVRISGGVQGYLHHSQVLVEALSSLPQTQHSKPEFPEQQAG